METLPGERYDQSIDFSVSYHFVLLAGPPWPPFAGGFKNKAIFIQPWSLCSFLGGLNLGLLHSWRRRVWEVIEHRAMEKACTHLTAGALQACVQELG